MRKYEAEESENESSLFQAVCHLLSEYHFFHTQFLSIN